MTKTHTLAFYQAQCAEAKQMARLERVMHAQRCSSEDAQRYIDLRDEGHSHYQAQLMAGLADPHDPS